MTANVAKKTISIPFRIQRSPTDLLKALSKTVEPDLSGPMYAFLDDPRLLPRSKFEKRTYLLSRASGVKAARLMIQKCPEAFMRKECEPHIPKFFPQKIFTEEELKYPSESLIFSLVSWGKFKQAFGIYLQCKENEIHVSDACKLALFDCLCLYNSQDLPEQLPNYETWVNRDFKQIEQVDNNFSSWKSGEEAEQMFKEMGEPKAQVYCSLIKGMQKYNADEKAKSYYDEMIAKNLNPDLNTVNGMLNMIPRFNTKADFEKKIELMMKYLNQLNNFGLRPNLHTFNSCLCVLKSCQINHQVLPRALDILKEMELLKIEPSLATWSHILSIFYPTRDLGRKTQVIQQVLEQVKNKSMKQNGLEWADVNDSNFFREAMKKARALDDINLVYKIHDLLMSNNNIKFLNDSHILESYFEEFLLSIINLELPDKVIASWKKYGNNFNITNFVLNQMIKFVVRNKCYDYFPEFWANYLEQIVRKDDVEPNNKNFLEFMIRYDKNDEDLLKEYGKIALSMIENYPYVAKKYEEQDDKRRARSKPEKEVKVYRWTGPMLSNLFTILLRANLTESCWSEFETYTKSQSEIYGELNKDCIMDLLYALIESNMIERAFILLDFVITSQIYEPKIFLKVIANHEKMLNDEQLTYLKQLQQKL